jgi:hypothetical protein
MLKTGGRPVGGMIVLPPETESTPVMWMGYVTVENLEASLANATDRVLEAVANGEPKLLWALRRKLAKELIYLERSNPAQRKKLKARKFAEQKGACAICGGPLPQRGKHIDGRAPN